MPWQDQVPLWVINAVSSYIIPSDANFVTDSSFAALDDPQGSFSSAESTYSGDFPGLLPNVSIKVDAVPATSGLDMSITISKAIGFYGVLSTVLSFDQKALNKWTFPLVRRNFGYLSLSKDSKVSEHGSILYDRQYHIDKGVLILATDFDLEKNKRELTNKIDGFALNRVDVFQFPSVVTRIGFLPILEEWAVKFFQANTG